MAACGVAEVNWIDCDVGPTAKDCCVCGAAANSSSPSWLASIVQVPPPMKLTVEPEIVHTELLAGSIVNVTGLPDPPPVASTV